MSIHFEWKRDMSVGEDKIDTQHQGLLAQINKIIDTLVLGVDSKEIAEAFSFFEKYIENHFSYEEHYMKIHNYPEFEEHKKKHEDFSEKYFKFKDKFNKGEIDSNQLIMEIETYLGGWWIGHIGKEDKKYHNFIDGIK